MQLEYAKYPVWVNSEHTMIDLTIKWGGINEEFPFTASPTDCEAHGREIFAAAVAGHFGEIKTHEEETRDQMADVFPTSPSGEIEVVVVEGQAQ
jgi:hypothetical protein